jgi:hypothetical protein
MFEKLEKNGFDILSTNHASAVLGSDFSAEIFQVEEALLQVKIPLTEIIAGGGGEAEVTKRLRRHLSNAGWKKHSFELRKTVDGIERESISHEIDHVRKSKSGTLALEIEWNNKDPFFDRDLENFKRLHAESAISVGLVVTRGKSLQDTLRAMLLEFAKTNNIDSFEKLREFNAGSPTVRQRDIVETAVARGKTFPEAWSSHFVSDKFGQATTHWTKLMDRVARGVGNPCPLVLAGIPASSIDANA